jgi:hypothetical protein
VHKGRPPTNDAVTHAAVGTLRSSGFAFSKNKELKADG